MEEFSIRKHIQSGQSCFAVRLAAHNAPEDISPKTFISTSKTECLDLFVVWCMQCHKANLKDVTVKSFIPKVITSPNFLREDVSWNVTRGFVFSSDTEDSLCVIEFGHLFIKEGDS